MIKLVFIEDNKSTIALLQQSVRLDPDLMCLLAVESVEDFWKQIPDRAQPHIIFLDIDLPGKSGIEALPALCRRYPQTDIVMLTQHEEPGVLLKAFHAGATGYLLKDFPWIQIRQHIDTIVQGGAVISPKMARFLNPPKLLIPSIFISPKESQVLKAFAEGASYEETADLLGATIDAIKYHTKNIYRKLNVDNKNDAVRAFNTDIL